MNDKYTFNISLSVLNHLGRNLYRNIITVIGEASFISDNKMTIQSLKNTSNR